MTIDDFPATLASGARTNTADILGDWGTTRLRLWRMDGDRIIDQIEAPGLGASPIPPLDQLRQAIQPWTTDAARLRIALCGMAGSRAGLVEAPYVGCPASRAEWCVASATLAIEGVDIRIAAGLSRDGSAPDVMRGEETQIFGAFHLRPDLAVRRCVVVTPGTHSKWALVEGGRIIDFRTFPTGELFDLVARRSSLVIDDGSSADADDGLRQGLHRARDGATVLGALFAARSGQLRQGRSHGWATGYLSGLLIGAEIAEGRALFAGEDVAVVIADPTLGKIYQRAFAEAEMYPASLQGDACAMAGLGLVFDPETGCR